jgi:putative DNA primase/helicase
MFHDDKTPSFSVIKFDDGHWRFKCFGCGASGDPIKYLTLSQGMSFADAVEYLAQESETAPMAKPDKPVKVYDYYDQKGVLLYQSCRYEPKAFRLRRPSDDPQSNKPWHWDMCGVSRVLYRLPSLLRLPAGSNCYYVEGERDVESMEQMGLVATTHAGGALSYRRELLDPVKHLKMVVIPDNDDPGKQLMRRVWADCRAKGIEVGFALLPTELNGQPVKDVTDYFNAGGTADALRQLVR